VLMRVEVLPLRKDVKAQQSPGGEKGSPFSLSSLLQIDVASINRE